ncbi:hypothetical protein OB955_03035 [Halobacteria archaeon AArc-m2/3/4]|uniref:Uncharacterized protein n=1 Tax=Natronoglomus mannanivorans TaxID=2979990 RepID=A0AAP2YWF1_9EURY|nr:hypothetical protein [Halobacteria archaeon AArc-xg1-1]MCU4971711.1 hypothetical protein [Halobacteria archaeon AArc-m2/3/4]
MAVDVGNYEHPAWVTAASTVVGYLLVFTVLFVVLFVVPWLLFGTL